MFVFFIRLVIYQVAPSQASFFVLQTLLLLGLQSFL